MIRILQNIDEFNSFFHQETCHPLVGVGDLSQADLTLFEPLDFGAYCVVLMDSEFGVLRKGDCEVQYGPGTMFTAKPGQTLSVRLTDGVKPRGKMLVVRPEMIENTGLGRDWYMFNFFDFQVFEALELNFDERRIILNCFSNIDAELHADNDELTGHMLRLGIGQLLSYCKRYYERQFDIHQLKSSDFIRRLDSLIDNYLAPGNELPSNLGIPTVAWCAAQFHLSPNYFGNLVRRDLHVSAQQYIHNKIIERARNILSDSSVTIDEAATQLGFSYANHFSRFFSKQTGMSPSQFRKSLSQQ